MTTLVQFNPQANSNFQFQATLDGNVYNIVINWNLFGARYYINIYTLAGKLIVCRPLIGSPLGIALDTITLANNVAVATAIEPHNFTVGSVIPLVITNALPSDYNGTYNCSVMNLTQFSFPLPSIGTAPSEQGTATFKLSLTAGYFSDTVVYLPDNEQFVID